MDMLNAAATTKPASSLFRLPTEAEYEFACRAGTTGESNYYFGKYDPALPADATTIDTYMWSSNNSTSPSAPGYTVGFTQFVGQKLPNAWGLYDMIGNVWEVCQDDWHDLYDVTSEYTGIVNGVSPTGVTVVAPTTDIAWVDSPRALSRSFRGGSCQVGQHYGQSKARGSDLANSRKETQGFRVVLQLP
jgi:formylglycine-generating enzyme required for sulfatase activity